MPFQENFTPVAYKDTSLFKPIQVGKFTLKHRVALAPLTRFKNELINLPTSEMLEYYDQRSKEEGTFIITEASFISEAAGGYDLAPGIYNNEQINKWKPIFAKIHENKSIVFQQLWALGRQSTPGVQAKKGLPYVCASDGIYMDEENAKAAKEAGIELRGLTKDEIKGYVKDYAQAAINSLKAGADGVEIHSANGYLLNQFLDSASNKRTDEYGGSIENKVRFTLEVVDAIVDAIGADRVGIRLSPYGVYGSMSGKSDPEYLSVYSYLIAQLEKRAQAGKRLAYIHLIEARIITAVDDETVSEYPDGSNEFIYDIWNGVVIKNGSYVLNYKTALKHIERKNTIIAYGRFFISNPDLPKRLRDGLPLNQYNRATFYGTPEGYTDYPTYEETLKLEKL